MSTLQTTQSLYEEVDKENRLPSISNNITDNVDNDDSDDWVWNQDTGAKDESRVFEFTSPLKSSPIRHPLKSKHSNKQPG